MIPRPLLAFAAAAGAALMASAPPPAKGDGQGGGAGDVRVSAYYYPWYSETGRHWELGTDGGSAGRGPALGRYDSRDPETLRRHLAWSEAYGIDNWICSWWGPESWEDATLRHHVLPALAQAAPGRRSPTFCLLYESEGLLGLDPERGIAFDGERIAAIADHFRHLCEHYFAHPAYLRIGGRPVVYLYLSRAYRGDVARALATIRAVAEVRGYRLFLVGDEIYWGDPEPARIGLLDALTAYNLHGPPDFAGLSDWGAFVDACDALYRRYREAATPLGVGVIPGILPGFDTAGRHYAIPRSLRPGAGPDSTLEAMAAMARRHLDPGLRAVAVTSFNEWHEGTQLEPSASGGETLRRCFKPPR